MRGRTLNDSFVILDEAQNTTSEQMKMFLTRLGFGSKAVITGDITQIDLPTGRTSGLVEAMKVVSAHRGHLVRLLRRSRRRPPQAGAADRQGVRGVLERERPTARPRRNGRSAPDDHDVRRLAASRASRAAPRVTVGAPMSAAARSAGLARWLARVAPAARAGRRQHRARQRRRGPRAEPHVSRQGLRDRRAEFSGRVTARTRRSELDADAPRPPSPAVASFWATS